MWFWIWVVLVLGGIATLVAVAIDTWRRASRAGHALADAAALADRASTRITELQDAPPQHPIQPVTVFNGLARAQRQMAKRRLARARSRAARLARRRDRWDQWSRFNT